MAMSVLVPMMQGGKVRPGGGGSPGSGDGGSGEALGFEAVACAGPGSAVSGSKDRSQGQGTQLCSLQLSTHLLSHCFPISGEAVHDLSDLLTSSPLSRAPHLFWVYPKSALLLSHYCLPALNIAVSLIPVLVSLAAPANDRGFPY